VARTIFLTPGSGLSNINFCIKEGQNNQQINPYSLQQETKEDALFHP